METWEIRFSDNKQDLKDSILIAGLPGIGNVGKIVTDFLVEEMKAKKVCEFFSYRMPHSVFVNDKNLVLMPKIELYFAEKNKSKLLILTGDTQPIDEVGCYSFCDALLDLFQKNKGKEVITLGGIGLQSIPKQPKVYCTGNEKSIIDRYAKDTEISTKVFGVVGPIIGITGVLVGLSDRRKIKAVSMLAETFGHPMFLGLKGAREILKILDKKLSLGLTMTNLDKEIKNLESKMKIADDIGKTVAKKKGEKGDVSYIG